MDKLNRTSWWTTASRSAIVAAAAATAFGAPEWIHTATRRWEILAEFTRSLAIAYVLAHLLAGARVRSWNAALLLGAGVCAFQAFILLGSVIHEHKPVVAYAVRGAYAVGSTLVVVAVLGFCKVFARDGRIKVASDVVPEPDPIASARTRGAVNYKALVLAAVAAVGVGGLWYSPLLFGGAWAHLRVGASVGGARIPPVEVLGEFVRSGVVAYVLARFINVMRVGWRGSLLLGGALWMGFHATLLLFSVIHEHMSVGLFAIHAGHGLVNDLVIAAIVGAWGARRESGSAGGTLTCVATTRRALEG